MGVHANDAEDLVQGFFLSILKSGSFSRADPQRGKLRTFLLTAFRRHAKDEWMKRLAAKRGDGAEHVSFDETRDPDPEGDTSAEFDRDWAEQVMQISLSRLERRYQEEEKKEVYDILRPYLSGDLPEGGVAVLAEQLDLSSGAAKVALHRIRKRFGEALRIEVADTLAEGEDVEAEIRFLFKAVTS
jgi:RNA polymerase sigma-70 factor (ECF subfamily)